MFAPVARGQFTRAPRRTFAVAIVIACASAGLQGATLHLIDDKPAVETASLSGFGGGAGWKVNSKDNPTPPFPSANILLLTNSNADEARSAFYEKTLPVVAGGSGFTASFTYTPSGDKYADGAAFVLHNDLRGASALGGYRGAIGVGTESDGIPIALSVEFEINIWKKPGIAWVSNGATGAYDSTGSVNVGGGDPIDVTLSYDPATITLSIKLVDQITKTTYSTSYKTLDVTSILGGSTAYVGFTGGGHRATQQISNFSYSVGDLKPKKADNQPATEPVSLSGFGGAGTGWKVNGTGVPAVPFPAANIVRLTNNTTTNEVRSLFYNTTLPVVAGSNGFNASFTYTASRDKKANGVAFVLHDDLRGPTALGSPGEAIGVGGGGTANAISPSVEFEINLYQTPGIVWTSNGTTGTYEATGSVDVASGHPIDVTLSYDPVTTTLTAKLVDRTTKEAYSTAYKTLNVASVLGNPMAYVGFTGSSGSMKSTQQISNFSYSLAGTSGSSPNSGAIVGFESESLILKPKTKDAAAVQVPLADIATVILDDQDHAATPAPNIAAKTTPPATPAGKPRPGPRWRVELGSADHVTASLANWTDARVTLAVDSLKSAALSIPVERVRAIWSTSDAKTKEAKDLGIVAQSQDVAFVESDGKVKSVTGVVIGVDGEFLKFKYDGEERKIKLDRLVGVLLAQRELPPEKSLYEVFTLVGGDVVSGRIAAFGDGAFSVAPLPSARGAAEQVSIRVPLTVLTKIEITGGRLAWIGDLKAAAVSQVPYFDRLMPYRVDTSLTGGPLALSDGIVTRGIAVHSKCVLTYDIGGTFAQFRTKLGFQQPEGKMGHAAVRVLGDGKVLWQDADLKGDAKPSALDLNVAGVKALTLEVDYGKNQDVGGRVVWGDARLIKR